MLVEPKDTLEHIGEIIMLGNTTSKTLQRVEKFHDNISNLSLLHHCSSLENIAAS